ncbi:MAG: GNAT family N-acetyltransferase [Bdellovibrionales bacterium]|nr:GNAT family N-acetyltransferase [Bdellovibrionales bacterium]
MMIFKDAQALKHVEAWVEGLNFSDLSLKSWSEATLTETLRTYNFVFLGAGGQPMTSCVVFQEMGPDLCEVLFLGTSPAYQGQGQMTELLEEFIHRCPYDRIWLECRADNLIAQNIYRKLGFVENGQRPNYYHDSTPAILFTFFRKHR